MKILILLSFLASIAYAEGPNTIRIAIIDSGYSERNAEPRAKLCDKGHYDFGLERPEVGVSSTLHGTAVASLISSQLEDVDYCLVIYNVEMADGLISMDAIHRALARALDEKLTAINISLYGHAQSFTEQHRLELLVTAGTTVFIAAGNSNFDLDETCNVFPACYNIKGTYMVGALSPDLTQKASYSNYGQVVDLWYPGHFQFNGRWAHGTSFASPYALSDYVLSLGK